MTELPDTYPLRITYAENIIAKLADQDREAFRPLIRKLVTEAERIDFAKKMLALSPGQIAEVVEQCQKGGHL